MGVPVSEIWYTSAVPRRITTKVLGTGGASIKITASNKTFIKTQKNIPKCKDFKGSNK